MSPCVCRGLGRISEEQMGGMEQRFKAYVPSVARALLPTVLVLQQAGPPRGLVGTYIYTVELFLGTSGCCPLPLTLYLPFFGTLGYA